MTLPKRILAAIYTAFLVYCCLSLTMGSAGVSEYRRLAAYKQQLTDNLNELEKIGGELNAKATVLRTEPETLKVFVRDLDYYQDDEGIILLEGYEVKQTSYSMGKMLSWTRIPENRIPLFRALAFSAGLIVFLLTTLLFMGQGSGNKSRG